MVFSGTKDFGRGYEVGQLIEPWAAKQGKLAVIVDREVSIPLYIPSGQERAEVTDALLTQLREIKEVLAVLPPTEDGAAAEQVLA